VRELRVATETARRASESLGQLLVVVQLVLLFLLVIVLFLPLSLLLVVVSLARPRPEPDPPSPRRLAAEQQPPPPPSRHGQLPRPGEPADDADDAHGDERAPVALQGALRGRRRRRARDGLARARDAARAREAERQVGHEGAQGREPRRARAARARARGGRAEGDGRRDALGRPQGAAQEGGVGPQARERGVDEVGEERGRKREEEDEREEGREVGVERGRAAGEDGSSVWCERVRTSGGTHDDDEKKNGVDDEARVDSSAAKSSRAAATICRTGSKSQCPAHGRDQDRLESSETHLALAERLLDALLAVAAGEVVALLDAVDARLEEGFFAPALVLGLLVGLAAEPPPRRVGRVDDGVRGVAQGGRAGEGGREGERGEEEGADEDPVLRELRGEAQVRVSD